MATVVKLDTFDKAVEECIEAEIVQEKKEFRPGLVPFKARAAKVRANLTGTFYGFQKSFARGYALILDELRAINTNDLTLFQPRITNLSLLDNPSSLIDSMSEGRSLYELLGFSPEALSTMCSAAHRMIEQNRVQDAKEAFFFLVTIAPESGACWHALGYCYGKCHEDDAAVEALVHAVELMPQDTNCYINLAHIFIKKQDFQQAKKVCEVGLLLTSQNPTAIWAPGLERALDETNREIEHLAQMSKQNPLMI